MRPPVSSFVLRVFRAALALALAVPPTARAEEPAPVSVTTSRVSLADVMPECPPRACTMDLGAAPAPGSSWWVDASVIRSALVNAGEPAPRTIRGVRVVSASRVLSPAEVGELVGPSIERALPPGVTLALIEAKSKLTLPLLGSAGNATLPKLPRRAGPMSTTALVDILLDGTLVRRVPVLVRLILDASAARASVPRGHTLTLVIERRAATISTDGIAMRDTEIGEVAPFKVQRTGRIINALVKSAGIAQVLEAE